MESQWRNWKVPETVENNWLIINKDNKIKKADLKTNFS